MVRRSWGPHRFIHLALWVLAVTCVGLGAQSILPWLAAWLWPEGARLAAIGFLVALEVSYWVVLLASLSGLLVCGCVVFRAQRPWLNRSRAARGLLLCASCLLGLALAETIAAARTASIFWAGSGGGNDPNLPLQFAERRDEAEVTVVVLGESSVVGVPYEAWLSIGRIVVWELEQAIPGRRFRLELLAKPGDTLENQHWKLASLRYRPNVLIVYSGHNEFISRFPWSREVEHYFDERSASYWHDMHELALRASAVCALIREAADKFRGGLVPLPTERRRLVDVPAYTSSERAARLADFERRLEAIVAYAGKVGALPLLIIPPANDADFEPSRSFLPAAASRGERLAFERAFRAARRLEDSDPERAIEAYRALVARHPGFAETHHRLAQLLDRTDARAESYQHFIAARDADGLPLRCLSSFQQAYRKVAAGHDCVLIDGQALFHAIGYRGLLDDRLFHDSVHPSVLGHVALAQAILDALWARRAFGWPREAAVPRVDPAACAAHFGLQGMAWKLLCERGAMFYNATAPLRYDPARRRAGQRAFEAAARRIAAGEAPESVGLLNVGAPRLSPTGGPSTWSAVHPP